MRRHTCECTLSVSTNICRFYTSFFGLQVAHVIKFHKVNIFACIDVELDLKLR